MLFSFRLACMLSIVITKSQGAEKVVELGKFMIQGGKFKLL